MDSQMAASSPPTLTPGSTVQLVRNSPRFMEPEGSFLCSQQPAICHILTTNDSVHVRISLPAIRTTLSAQITLHLIP
jgi:hypothetical protein